MVLPGRKRDTLNPYFDRSRLTGDQYDAVNGRDWQLASDLGVSHNTYLEAIDNRPWFNRTIPVAI